MAKLGFLAGKWSGEARVVWGPAGPTALIQTEGAQFKLDGLILVIEGVGRPRPDGAPVLQAFFTSTIGVRGPRWPTSPPATSRPAA